MTPSDSTEHSASEQGAPELGTALGGSTQQSADLTRLGGAQRLLQHIVAAEDPQRWLDACGRGELAELGLTEADGRALAGVDPRRLLVYRKLIRGTLRDTFSAQLPRTAARLGRERVDALVGRFCAEQLPRSQVLRDVAFEICAFALPRWEAEVARDDPPHGEADAGQDLLPRSDTEAASDAPPHRKAEAGRDALPPFMGDLARFELFEFDVYAADISPRGWPAADADELHAERAVAFDGSLRFARFDWRADLLPDDAADRTTPAQEAVRLLAYRDAEGAYRQLELTPLAATILQQLWRGEALGAAITAGCAAHQQALDQSVIDGISQVLADLGERGVLLGGCAPGARKPPSPWALWLCSGQKAP